MAWNWKRGEKKEEKVVSFQYLCADMNVAFSTKPKNAKIKNPPKNKNKNNKIKDKKKT